MVRGYNSVMSSKTLTLEEQKDWLDHHIPDRFRAAASHLKFLDDLLGTEAPGDPPSASPDHKIRRYCELVSIQQGRLAALRWLLDFVRIDEKTKQRKENDVTIAHFEGAPSPLTDQNLTQIRNACNKACSHPTYGSNPSEISDDKQCEALEVIFNHLKKSIYANVEVDLKSKILSLPGSSK
jgi:hypothetical protein